MTKIQILTDSTSALPKKLLKKFKIETVPMNIIWDGQTFADDIDLERDEFFERLHNSYHVPTTAAPTPGAFREAFENIGKSEGQILAILMGQDFSSTLQTAELAAGMLPNKHITLWDSHSISMGLGFQVLAAARAVDQGKNLEEIKEILRHLRSRSGVFLTVEDLNYLRRGGRLNRSQYLLASTMGFRPILEVRGGPMEAIDRARSDRGMRARLIDLVEERVADARPLRVAVGYSDNKAKADILSEMVKDELKPDELFTSPISQANSVHGGNGTLGISYSYGY